MEYGTQASPEMVLLIHRRDEVRTRLFLPSELGSSLRPSLYSALYVVCMCFTEHLFGFRSLPCVTGDIADDKYFRKANDSDATQWSIMYPKTRAHVWAIFWITFEVAVIIGFVLLGIAALVAGRSRTDGIDMADDSPTAVPKPSQVSEDGFEASGIPPPIEKK